MDSSAMWATIPDQPVRLLALDVVLQTAERLRNPQQVTRLAALAHARMHPGVNRCWSPIEVASESARIALLFGQLARCFPEADWDQVAQAYLAPTRYALATTPIPRIASGLLGGLAGLCFAIDFLAPPSTRYGHLRMFLDDILLKRVIHQARIPVPFCGARVHEYDHISGLAGIGAYLLLRQEHPLFLPAMHALLDRLVFFSERQGAHLGFFIPPEHQPTERHRAEAPQGSIDCGLAHGVPGPLALMSLAVLSGIERPGLRSAIRRLATWLVDQGYEDDWGINWPTIVLPGASGSARYSKAAWCYGSPGVARALWLAGQALAAPALSALAVDAMVAVGRRPVVERHIPGPIVCHGVAGTLQIVLRFAHDTGDVRLCDLAVELTRQLLGMFAPDAPVGFRDVEAEDRSVDDPGLMNGAAGIALVLLAAATRQVPVWDRLLLLS